jgi:hypothetical protein
MGFKRMQKKYMSRFLEEARGLTETGSYTEREMIETLIELYERKFRDEKYLLFLKEKLKRCSKR